ncbi:MAG: hypothetical protein Q8L69_00275, partial [Gallionellaceae bacterium]|nr:hypothetical protein [Gallionellaceae bacterium]
CAENYYMCHVRSSLGVSLTGCDGLTSNRRARIYPTVFIGKLFNAIFLYAIYCHVNVTGLAGSMDAMTRPIHDNFMFCVKDLLRLYCVMTICQQAAQK